MIYTSRFSNPELKSGNYTVVGIVCGVPRFRLGYERAENIIDITPTEEAQSLIATGKAKIKDIKIEDK